MTSRHKETITESESLQNMKHFIDQVSIVDFFIRSRHYGSIESRIKNADIHIFE